MLKILFAIILLIAALGAVPLHAAYIVSAEYFYDTDPGPGNGLPLTVPSSGDPLWADTLVTINPTLPTGSLSSGLHRLAIRYRDNLGRWGIADVRLFYLLNELPPAYPNITAAEYFFDVDPGAGNATALAVTPGQNPVIAVPLSVSSLQTGLHRIGIRYRDQYNRWGLTDSRLFYLLLEQLPPNLNLTAAEYFFDTDPGRGSATPLTVTPGPNPTISAALSVSGLSNGLHRICLRYRDQNNRWGLADARLFYILNEVPPALPNIVQAEYFLDSDPGLDNGHDLTISPGTNPAFSGSLDLTGLHTGLHRICVRYKDQNNHWSIADARLFYLLFAQDSIPTQQHLAGAEYFINADPGVGSGVSIALPLDGAWNDTLENVADSVSGIPVGQHWVGMRYRDNRGNWGATAVDTFIVGPVVTIYPDPTLSDIILNWQTGPGATSFDVQRSATVNGQFTTIGTTSTNTYTDPGILNNPAMKNYYRIVQTTAFMSTYRLPAARAAQHTKK
jgi:hypothetical protein